jgi:hypothetical protein
MSTEPIYTESEAHQHFAKACNLRVWELAAKAERTPVEDAELLDAAHASLYHWRYVGTGVNLQRGEWLISHAYSLLDNGEGALRHAERCLALTGAHQAELADFDVAYAYLGMARAHAILGNHNDAHWYLALAKEAGKAIAEEEDRDTFTGDLESGNWYGIR